MPAVTLGDVELWEAPESEWSGAAALVGQREALDLCRLALRLPVGGYRANGATEAARFFPVLLGPPGVGKTTLAFQAAREAAGSRGVFVVHCHGDMQAEDLVVTPVLSASRRVRYQLSPLATAALRGAAVILDEASRLQPAAWASVMGAFDERRSLPSVAAGVAIPVREGFAAILTMNRDAETHELPPAMRSRLGPFIALRSLSRAEQAAMIRRTMARLPEEALLRALEFLQETADEERELSPRDLLSVFRICERLEAARGPGTDRRELLRLALALNRPPPLGGDLLGVPSVEGRKP